MSDTREQHHRVVELLEIAEALHSTNAMRGRQVKECAEGLQRKIWTLESNLKDINTLYMGALAKLPLADRPMDNLNPSDA
jgi:hypothetical protein